MSTFDIKAVMETAKLSVAPTFFAAEKLLYIPSTENTKGEVFDLDKIFLGREDAPRRKIGTVKVFNVQSLNSFIAHNKDAGNIVIYCDSNTHAPMITAVLNDNGDTGPGKRDFRCVVEFRKTPEWIKWLNIDGKYLPQVDFAEFVEENMADIAEPLGAQMLEICTYLDATRSVDFKSAINLSNGNIQFTNVENINASVSSSQIAVPTEFTLGIAPIQGSPRFSIKARFRYRLVEGKLKLGLKLLRTEEVMAEVFDMAVADIVRTDGEPHPETGEIVGPRISIIEGTP